MSPFDVIALAALGGFIPALVWLWFWLREDKNHPEPWQYITLTFIAGMVAVPLVIPFQKALYPYLELTYFVAPMLVLFLWAFLEEIFKYFAAYFAALKSPVNDEPIDPVIYLITAALGFAALESTLYLIGPYLVLDVASDTVEVLPLTQDLLVDSVVISNLRFLGAALLHVVASAVVGLFLAFSFRKPKSERRFYLFMGILLASILHTGFNIALLFPGDGIEGVSIAFSIVWLSAIMLILLFEKVKTL